MENKPSSNSFKCEYSDKFLTCYEDASKAYNKNWSEWILKARNSIEEFCKYYICWLCGEDKDKAKNILRGNCDFEYDIPQNERTVPQGRRLITIIYQKQGNQLERFISNQKLYLAYSMLSEFIHNSLSPTEENTERLRGVLERLYSIYMWTTNKDYSERKEEDKPFIRQTHTSIKFISNKGTYNVNISDISIQEGRKGDHMIVIKSKHHFIMDRDYTVVDKEVIKEILKHDWTILQQEGSKFVNFSFDTKKVNEEIQWGMSQLKNDDKEHTKEVDDLYNKIVAFKNGQLPEAEEFIKCYSIIRGLQPVVPVFVDYKKWLVLRDKVKAEDTNFLFGNDARIYIEGLDDNKNYVKKSIDLKISHAKSEKIRKINKHQFDCLDLIKVSNQYNILINLVHHD